MSVPQGESAISNVTKNGAQPGVESDIELSIIIVNWNVCDYLRECLTSLRNEMILSRDRYEVIVVDNDSQDESVSMLRREFPDVILHESGENLGFGRGCNRGWALAQGDFILLLNPDTVVVDHAIDVLLEDIRNHPRTGIVGGRLTDQHGQFQRDGGGAFPTLANTAWRFFFLDKLLPSGWGPKMQFLADDPQGRQSVDWISGADMLLRREAVGDHLFDEAFFMYGEDMDLCNRIHESGWEIAYTSKATIIHHLRRSFEQQSDTNVLQAIHKGPRAFFQKKNGRFAAFLFDLIMLAGFVLRWIFYSLAGLFRPGSDYARLAVFSRRYVAITLRHLFRRDLTV